MPHDLSLKSMAAKASLDHACPRLTIKNAMVCAFCNTLTCNLAKLSEFVRSRPGDGSIPRRKYRNREVRSPAV